MQNFYHCKYLMSHSKTNPKWHLSVLSCYFVFFFQITISIYSYCYIYSEITRYIFIQDTKWICNKSVDLMHDNKENVCWDYRGVVMICLCFLCLLLLVVVLFLIVMQWINLNLKSKIKAAMQNVFFTVLSTSGLYSRSYKMCHFIFISFVFGQTKV